MNTITMRQLKDRLQLFGYHCESIDDYKKLYVYLGVDKGKRIWLLTITPTEFPLNVSNETKVHFLDFFLSFPFLCEAASSGETARLLLLLNKSLPFPAFGLSEIEGVVYYRHILHCEQGLVPVTLTCSIIGNLCLYLDSLASIIESVAIGHKQLVEVLEEILSLKM